MARTPNKIALVFEENNLTYRELNERANQLAHAIRANFQQHHGIPFKVGTLIALYLDRSLEMVIGIMAILKAGGAYVPIAPEYPQARLLFILGDTQAPLLITQKHHLEKLANWLSELKTTPTLLVTDESATTAAFCQHNLSPISGAENLAYVIYTSGTTGKPKGVMVTHRNVVHLTTAQIAHFGIGVCQHALQFAAYVFDASVFELFVSLFNGLKIYLCNEAERKSADQLNEILQREEIEFATLPPALLALFKHSKNSLKVLITAGETPTSGVLEHFGNARVFNAYGPTEATVCASAHLFQPHDSNANIGKPLNNTRLYVLNLAGLPVPIGAPGELYIGGAGVARGYLNQPGLTAEQFCPNPFADGLELAQSYTRLYKTGDMVRWLVDGSLEFLGRNDTQVKIRGFRVELGEIESVLTELPQVKQAVVIAREHECVKFLAAYVIPTDDEPLLLDILREVLASKLPEYMVPATFTELNALPLTINGKLDRKALPTPHFTNEETYTAPRNTLEQELCTLWQEVLDLKRVSVFDSFFHLGGHSILAIRLVSQLNAALNRNLSVASLFANNCIADLAEFLRREDTSLLKQLTPSASDKPPIFMIHAAHSGCEVYQKLASSLKNEFNCIGIDNYNLISDQKIGTLHEIAEMYLKLVLEGIQPDQPVRLLGWSMGGFIALELAFRLEQQGHRNLELFLIDTYIQPPSLQGLYQKLNQTSLEEGTRAHMLAAGYEANYIEEVLAIHPFEEQIHQGPLSGILQYAKVTLFKAEAEHPQNSGEVWREIAQVKQALPDNNIAPFVKGNFSVISVPDRHHFDILEEIQQIRSHIQGQSPRPQS